MRSFLILSLFAATLFMIGCDDDDTSVGCNDDQLLPNPTGRIYVPNQADQTIFIYDTKTLQRIDSVETPIVEPHFVQFSPDYQYYYILGRQVGGQIAKYRVSDNSIVETITVETFQGNQVFPTSLAISKNNQTLFLTDFSDVSGFMYRYRVAGDNFSYLGDDSVIQAGYQTHDIRISPDGRYVVSAGFNSDDIAIFNTEIGDLIPLSLVDASPTFNTPALQLYGPYGVQIGHNSNFAYIACRKGVDQIRIVDLNNKTIVDSILIPINNSPASAAKEGPTYMTLLPDNNTLVVTSNAADDVYVVRISTREVVKVLEFDTPNSFGATSSTDGSRIYISCTNSRPNPGRVYVIDGNSLEKIDSITVGSEPFGLQYAPIE